jgi:hypothetical protein
MNRTTILLAATMALGSFALAPNLFAADAPANSAAGQQQRGSAQPAADVNAVRTLIGNSSAAAVRETGFADLVGNFAMPPVNPANNPAQLNAPAPAGSQAKVPANDANNANTATSVQTDKLNDQIRLFRQAFKTKYGEDFAIKDAQTLYGDITAANLNEAQAQPAAAEIKGTPADAQTTPPPLANTDADNSKNMMNAPEWTTLSVPEYLGAPAVTIHLVREGNTFKYATIQPVNQQTLATSLTDCLAKLNNDPSHWPADANTAARLVSQHVLGAIQKTQQAEMKAAQAPANNGGNSPTK